MNSENNINDIIDILSINVVKINKYASFNINKRINPDYIKPIITSIPTLTPLILPSTNIKPFPVSPAKTQLKSVLASEPILTPKPEIKTVIPEPETKTIIPTPEIKTIISKQETKPVTPKSNILLPKPKLLLPKTTNLVEEVNIVKTPKILLPKFINLSEEVNVIQKPRILLPKPKIQLPKSNLTVEETIIEENQNLSQKPQVKVLLPVPTKLNISSKKEIILPKTKKEIILPKAKKEIILPKAPTILTETEIKSESKIITNLKPNIPNIDQTNNFITNKKILLQSDKIELPKLDTIIKPEKSRPIVSYKEDNNIPIIPDIEDEHRRILSEKDFDFKKLSKNRHGPNNEVYDLPYVKKLAKRLGRSTEGNKPEIIDKIIEYAIYLGFDVVSQ